MLVVLNHKDNEDAGLLLCCSGPGGYHDRMEKTSDEKIQSMFLMGK